ncbi:NUDIX hydrolase [Mariniplasma anaerobium]|uniref:ADP-ribose pyrophosphatase n=1 Tax=Mariniplasma anaerobium TaxID=2735436 RepID=A0A7U9XVE3_9MOLU|nr:NUDIX hydrolase [Mariniplasma anaerobium]BCR36268.1 ADP-ribose pyrophosphatase [Mariniplasma anaerobium]
MKEIKINSKKVYTCSFMDVYEDDVRLPDQRVAKRNYIKHPGGAAMLAITKKDKVILIKQYRYPLDEIIFEIPAGKMDVKNESFRDCAIRELEEETGYYSKDVSFLYQVYPCVGYSDEKIEIFLAKDAYKVEKPIDKDVDEFIEVYLFSKQEAKNLLINNQIKDGKTLIALTNWIYT